MQEAPPLRFSLGTRGKPTTSVNLTNHLSSPSYLHEDDERSHEESLNIDTAGDPILSTATIGISELNVEIRSLITSELNSVYPMTIEQGTKVNTSKINNFIAERHKGDKLFFMFTSAGKLIFSQLENESYAMGLSGILHTVMSHFEIHDKTDIVQFSTFRGGAMTRFVFLKKMHVTLMVQTKNNFETTEQLREQLDFVYSYIISSVSQRNLNKLMNKRSNFDLQNYLTDLDQKLLFSICESLSFQPRLSWLTNSLECVPIAPKLRLKLNALLSKHYENLNILNHNGQILYTIITSLDLKLVSILRPLNHTLHTVDLQILFEIVGMQITDLLLDKVLWFPICFSKFNDNGFLYALVRLLPNKTILIIISSQKDSFTLINQFADGLLNSIANEKKYDILEFPLLDWHSRFPYVNHFVYKLKSAVQIYTPFKPTSEILQFYVHLKNLAKDDQGKSLNKSQLSISTWKHTDEPGKLVGVCWMTQKFELLLLLNDINLTNDSILRQAKKLVQHIREMESYLFISKGATF